MCVLVSVCVCYVFLFTVKKLKEYYIFIGLWVTCQFQLAISYAHVLLPYYDHEHCFVVCVCLSLLTGSRTHFSV